MNKSKNYFLLAILIVSSFLSFAEDSSLNTENCVASKWTEAGQPISIEQKFGAGSMAVTRCLKKTSDVKVVFQVNRACKSNPCKATDPKPYAIGNIQNQIKDYSITHGMKKDDYRIAVVVHSGGWKLVLNDGTRNKFKDAVVNLLKNPSVKMYFCQNTAHNKGVKIGDMIDGIGFVTAGVSALSDFQESGYQPIHP